eukprot:TRINITY_DN9658_c0_g1_i1.p1 TRINITY_DN9658_c0_g1~~TRINITY_DN9658_c0_g1_i1.p1  ORF type:complete len:373 (-),score=102.34 TRINITY_DN9658_c0_g1_i1:96-1214(-)
MSEFTPQDYLNKLKSDMKISKDVSHELIIDRDGETTVFDRSNLGKKPVVYFKQCRGCEFTIGHRASVVKVLIEDCHDCVIRLDGSIKTNVVEIWKCTNTVVHINTDVFTLQVDLCDGLTLSFEHKKQLSSIIEAGMRNFAIEFKDSEDFNFHSGFDVLEAKYPGINDQTDQFITRWVDKEILTEEIIRLPNGYPTTEREKQIFDEQKDKNDAATLEYLENFLTTAGPSLGLSEAELIAKSVEGRATEQELVEIQSQANMKKMRGNKFYSKGNYEQALALYSEGLEIDPENAVLYSNRSATNYNLGNIEAALEDANKCIEVDGDFMKGYLRKGEALVKLEQWEDAKNALKEAYDLDPENEKVNALLEQANSNL